MGISRTGVDSEETAWGGGGGDGEGERGPGAGQGWRAGVRPGAAGEGVGAPERVNAARHRGEVEGEVSVAEHGTGDAEGFTLRGVAEGVVHIGALVESTPNDHFSARPHGRMIDARRRCASGAHRRPAVASRMVAPAGVQAADVIGGSAPNDHLSSGPHRRVREASVRRAGVVHCGPVVVRRIVAPASA